MKSLTTTCPSEDELVPHDLARTTSLWKLDEELQGLMERAQQEEAGPCPHCEGHGKLILPPRNTDDVATAARGGDMDCPECSGKGTGVIAPATRQALEAYFAASLEKVDRIAEYLKHFDVLDRARKDEKKRLDERGRVAANNDARVRRWLQEFMDGRSITQIKGKLNTITLCNNSKATLKITDREKIPTKFQRMTATITREWWDGFSELCKNGVSFMTPHAVSKAFMDIAAPFIDEAALRAALEAGESIPGATLEIESHLRIR